MWKNFRHFLKLDLDFLNQYFFVNLMTPFTWLYEVFEKNMLILRNFINVFLTLNEPGFHGRPP